MLQRTANRKVLGGDPARVGSCPRPSPAPEGSSGAFPPLAPQLAGSREFGEGKQTLQWDQGCLEPWGPSPGFEVERTEERRPWTDTEDPFISRP